MEMYSGNLTGISVGLQGNSIIVATDHEKVDAMILLKLSLIWTDLMILHMKASAKRLKSGVEAWVVVRSEPWW